MKASMQKTTTIHPTALVDPTAKLGEGVQVGPYCIVAAGAEIGDRCQLESHVRIEGCVRMGPENHVFQGAVLGSPPQDLKYAGEESYLRIGAHNDIREYVTMNPGTAEGEETIIGDHCLVMAYAHVAHNCILGDRVILANSVQLAGHVTIEDYAIIGGLTPVHQFTRIGAHSFVGGGSRVPQDVPPYIRAAGNPLVVAGINLVGIQRRGFSAASIEAIKKAYRILYRSNLNTSQAIERLEAEGFEDEHARHLLDFVRSSERGISK